MTAKDLKMQLEEDLYKLGLPVEKVVLSVRPYSKSYYGRYFPVKSDSDVKPRVFVYPYKDENCGLYSYDTILETAIHELVHHLQYTNPNFKRIKGVMHNEEFWLLYNHYTNTAKTLGLIDWRFSNER